MRGSNAYVFSIQYCKHLYFMNKPLILSFFQFFVSVGFGAHPEIGVLMGRSEMFYESPYSVEYRFKAIH